MKRQNSRLKPQSFSEYAWIFLRKRLPTPLPPTPLCLPDSREVVTQPPEVIARMNAVLRD